MFGYFTPERRVLLEHAEQQLVPYLQDNLAAIVPDPARGNNWSIQVLNTATGQNVAIPNPTIAANVIRIYAWGAPAGSFPKPDTLATGGSVGFSAQGYQAWYDTIIARGQAGRLASPATDTSVFAIRIDVNRDVPAYESTTPPPPGRRRTWSARSSTSCCTGSGTPPRTSPPRGGSTRRWSSSARPCSR